MMIEEPDVKIAVLQSGDLLRRSMLLQHDFHSGPAFSECLHHARQNAEQRDRSEPDAKAIEFTLGGTLGKANRQIDLVDNAPGLLQQHAAGRCQRHLTGGSLEKLHFKGKLQPADGLGQRRLRHAETRRGAAEMQFFGHRDEMAQMVQFHGSAARNNLSISKWS